jgi:ribonuclease HII
LSEKTREILYDIISREALVWSVAAVSHGTIDRINILNATLRAMLKSVNRLEIKPDLILIDGNRSFNCDIPARTIVKGDQKSFCIAAASILAKVTRDRLMKRLAAYFPAYRWEKNKGYATQEHINAVKVAGPSPLHRKTFLRNILDHKTETEFDLETAL